MKEQDFLAKTQEKPLGSLQEDMNIRSVHTEKTEEHCLDDKIN